jgi:hypothetical protein
MRRVTVLYAASMLLAPGRWALGHEFLSYSSTVTMKDKRNASVPASTSVRLLLTRKLAEIINGIDLSHSHTGEEIEVSARDADLLMAEGWAARVECAHDEPTRRRSHPAKTAPHPASRSRLRR